MKRSKTKVLDRERDVEMSLAGRFDDLAVAHIGLAESVARRFARGRDWLFDDLAQEGAIGLMRAARKWDPEYGTTFVTYAHHIVERSIVAFLHKTRRLVAVPNSAEGRTASAIMWRGDADSADDLRARLAISETMAIRLFDLLAYTEGPLVKTDPNGVEYEWIANDCDPEVDAMLSEVSRIIREVIASTDQLTEAERDIITLRYLGKVPMTLKEVGRLRAGVTKQRVDNLEAKAFKKLAKVLKHVA